MWHSPLIWLVESGSCLGSAVHQRDTGMPINVPDRRHCLMSGMISMLDCLNKVTSAAQV